MPWMHQLCSLKKETRDVSDVGAPLTSPLDTGLDGISTRHVNGAPTSGFHQASLIKEPHRASLPTRNAHLSKTFSMLKGP